MKTKLIALILCLVSLGYSPAFALNLIVGNNSTVAGGTASIPVTLAGAPTNLSAFCFFLTNDSAIGVPAVAIQPIQTNLVLFVDNFSNGVYRVTGFVTNDPPIGNGTVASLIYATSPGATPGTYPLVLPAAPPANAPAGSNPEARSLAASDLIPTSGTNGYVLIVTISPPYLTSPIVLGNGACQFSFTNANGASFSVLATTNLAQPLSNWTFIGVASQVLPGSYQFVDPAATNYPLRFYSVHSP